MSTITAETVYQTIIRDLIRDEKQRLIELIQRDLPPCESDSFTNAWERVKAMRPYHYWDEESQEWISRTRGKADESRETAIGGCPGKR